MSFAAGFTSDFLENARNALQRVRRPLAVLILPFLGGLFAGYRLPWCVWVGTLLFALLLGVALRRDRRWRLFLTLILAGWTAGGVLGIGDGAFRRYELDRAVSVGQKGRYICRVGGPVRFIRKTTRGVAYTFTAAEFLTEGGKPLVRRIPVEVTWYDRNPAYGGRMPVAGERWRIDGTLRKGRDRHRLPVLRVNTRWEHAEPSPSESGRYGWGKRVEALRRAAVRRVTIGIEDWGVVPQLNQAILLGVRNEIPPEMRRIFADSGTIHVFAISGLHIVLIAQILTLVIAMTGLPRTYWVFLLAPILALYTVLTGARPSAIRACLMVTLYYAAPLFGRRNDSLSVLAGTALLVYCFRPALLFDVGCMLSFSVMAGVLLFCGPFSRALERLFRLAKLEEWEGLWARGGYRCRAWCVRMVRRFLRLEAGALAVTGAAWLASVPLTATYFGRCSPGGLVANLIVAPASLFVVIGGCLGMVLSLVSATVASCYNHAAGLFTTLMIKAASWAVSIPGGSFKVSRWPVWLVALWFLALLVWAFILRVRRADGCEWME
ncbi:MAG: ComEC/Rec2 family competence protein [Kiritimatiellae bacterium]|nr:ComEC/Rec2 family competence protein [Kiritimatiellia bacterium]